MLGTIGWGEHTLALEVGEGRLVVGERAPMAANLGDPAAALREALEHPLDYPALRQALTPDDHVAIVVDEGLPQLAGLLVPLLEHLEQGRVQPAAVTLLCGASSSGQAWIDDLPDAFQDVRVEVHQPGDRKKLAYLATTGQGRRIYLNRTAVDADLLVLLTRRGYDPDLGCTGAEVALYPGLCDSATLDALREQQSRKASGAMAESIRQEAHEVAWLLGAPFFVQVIEGSGDGIAGILAGPLESSAAGESMLHARWRVTFAQPADVVIAGVTGSRVGMNELARALSAAARVVRPGGSIVLLTDAAPELGPAFEMLRREDDPGQALPMLKAEKPTDLAAGLQWSSAASHAKLYLLSGLAEDVAEELYAIPLQRAEQAQKLLTAGTTSALLPDAHRSLTVLR